MVRARPDVAPFAPPDAIDEYRLVRFLGEGAMGQVYLYQDCRIGRSVAVKFMRAPSEELRARLLTEARAVGKLSHPNVVSVYRFGEVDGCPYMASEFIEGRSLGDLPMPVDPETLGRLARGLASGLAHAHQQGVLHRDIKPANVMLSARGEPKLVDFGLAKLDQPIESSFISGPLSDSAALAATGSHHGDAAPPAPAPALVTRDGTLIGTPLYMSPEQWRGEPATKRSDVYALGALLYHCAAGQPPHRGEDFAGLAVAVLHDRAPALASLAPRLDPRLAALIDRCLGPTASRPASGVELAAALDSLTHAPRRHLRRVLLPIAAAAAVGVGAWAASRALQRGPVFFPGGRFRMGSSDSEIAAAKVWCDRNYPKSCDRDLFEREGPQRWVRLSPFWIDAREVTNAQFAAWLRGHPGLSVARPSKDEVWVMEGAVRVLDLYPGFDPSHGIAESEGRFSARVGLSDLPVQQVTWDGALRYCQARGARLPTEAEWEFVARGEEGTRFPWGDEEPRCEGVVFGRDAGLACAHLGMRFASVGTSSQDRTPRGVFDLAGNVAEWVMDRFTERYAPCPGDCVDPSVPGATGGPILRVFRGGSLGHNGSTLRGATRSRWEGNVGLKDVGFRCAANHRF